MNLDELPGHIRSAERNQTRLNHRESLDLAAQLLFAFDQSDCLVGATGYVIVLLFQILVISETALLLKAARELPC